MVGSQRWFSFVESFWSAKRGSLETAGVVELSVCAEDCASGHFSEQLSSLASRGRCGGGGGADGKLPGDMGGGQSNSQTWRPTHWDFSIHPSLHCLFIFPSLGKNLNIQHEKHTLSLNILRKKVFCSSIWTKACEICMFSVYKVAKLVSIFANVIWSYFRNKMPIHSLKVYHNGLLNILIFNHICSHYGSCNATYMSTAYVKGWRIALFLLSVYTQTEKCQSQEETRQSLKPGFCFFPPGSHLTAAATVASSL